MRKKSVRPLFVQEVPGALEDGKIYICMEYGTAIHLCCCGCGLEVVTPFSPKDWSITYDGESVSLDPSIGNWNFPCRSHYWIRKGRIVWAEQWSDERVAQARRTERLGRVEHAEVKEKSMESVSGRWGLSYPMRVWSYIKKAIRRKW